MRYFIIAGMLVLAVTSTAFTQGNGKKPQRASLPAWIWTSPDRKPDEQSRLVHEFEATGRVTEAQLRLAADFCRTSLILNGKTVTVLDACGPWLDLDVTDEMRSGRNRIELHSRSTEGPAAVALGLTLTLADGTHQTVNTNSKWKADSREVSATSFGEVARELWNSATGTSAFDDYTQWEQAKGGAVKPDPAKFATRPGFTIEHVRTAARDEDSWVSMAFDGVGRLTIAKEKKGLLRFTLTSKKDSVEVTKAETINDTLLECRGLLYAYDSLYANANNSKGLFRLRDTTGDSEFDEVKKLGGFPGGVGHGRNDLALGPDGMIYSIHGDAVRVPWNDILDRTSPFRDARRGLVTTEGHLVRTDKDGKQFELLAAGLRNPFGIAFNNDGGLFTYDADAEHDMGAPWYRPTRIDHLVSGADFGWRGRTGEWPPYYPDHADNSFPAADIGKGSPTALCSGLRTAFPFPYRQSIFVLDWTYGRILACHQTPRGAGWLCRAETFLKGRPLNVTDLAVGPEGALYLITGGRGTESSLYRIRYTGPTTASLQARSRQQVAREKLSKSRRDIRRQLEAFHGVVSPEAIKTAWPYLGTPDPVLRHSARVAVEHQPIDGWKERALAESDSRIAVTALLALARSKQEELFPVTIANLNRQPLAELSAYDALSAVQAYLICIPKPESLEQQLREKTRRRISKWLAEIINSPGSPPVGAGGSLQRELARLAIHLSAPEAVSQVVTLLVRARTQSDRMHYLYLLRNEKDDWTASSREDFFEALRDLERTALGGAGMPTFFKLIRGEAEATLTDAERKQLGDLLKPGNEVPESALTINRPLVREWGIADLDALLAPVGGKANPNRGRELFETTLCSRCHRLGLRGGLVGPDLTSVASRFSRRDILTSILDPSRVVAGKYRNSLIVTGQGRTITGRVVTGGDYRSPKLKIATDPLRPSQIVEVAKSEIEIHQESMLSPMPKGLLNSLNKPEILDLLAALQAGKLE